jgi:hypothetical protein
MLAPHSLLVAVLTSLAALASVGVAHAQPWKTPAANPTMPDLTVRMTLMSAVDSLQPGDITREVDAIWARHGVRFEWQSPGDGTGRAPLPDVWVVVGDGLRQRTGDRRRDHTILGSVQFGDGRVQNVVRISVAAVWRALESYYTRGFVPFEPALANRRGNLARAVGRALAHELGHVLLQTRRHAKEGLMRTALPPRVLAGESRDGFGLEPAELGRLRVQLLARRGRAAVVAGRDE